MAKIIYDLLFSKALEDNKTEVLCGNCFLKPFIIDTSKLEMNNENEIALTVKCPHCNEICGYRSWYNW